MTKKKNENKIDGQMSIFDFCVDASNYVSQSNEVISGKQSLSINAAKILRCAIMQIKPDDKELKPYIVTISELAKLLNIPRQDVHRDIDNLTDEIIRSPLYLKQDKDGVTKWVKIPWISICKYDSEQGVLIQLNEQMKPKLLDLIEQGHYTQYTLESILTMKSVFSIRLFEIIQSKIMVKVLPKNGKDIDLTVEEIRQACELENKFLNFSSFRSKVVDRAIKEINEKTVFRIDYPYLDIRKGKKIIGFRLHVNMMYH